MFSLVEGLMGFSIKTGKSFRFVFRFVRVCAPARTEYQWVGCGRRARTSATPPAAAPSLGAAALLFAFCRLAFCLLLFAGLLFAGFCRLLPGPAVGWG